MYRFFVLASLFLPFLAWDWHARMVLIASVYPRKNGHGKSFKRAKKHYKSNWSFGQRMLWIPLFKEKYEFKHRLLAYLSYIHLFLAIAMSVFFLIDDHIHGEGGKFIVYVAALNWVFVCGRFVFTNAIGRQTL